MYIYQNICPGLQKGQPGHILSQQSEIRGHIHVQQGPHAYECVHRPPYSYRSRRAKWKRPTGRVTPTHKSTSDENVLQIEGRYSYLIPLSERDGLYSWHAYLEYRRRLLSPEVSNEEPPECETGENRMYLEAWLQKRRHFSPSVISLDRLLGIEAEAMLKHLVRRLYFKWRQLYSRTCCYVRNRVAITLVHETHICMRGLKVPAS